MHRQAEPGVLYLGTPVVLVSTRNPDGTANVAPFSSMWWLGWSCMLGLGAASQTSHNLIRERECVVNLPTVEMVTAVDRLALLTGRNPVPEAKAEMGYRFEPDKFGAAGLTPVPAHLVQPPRVAECPIQLECTVEHVSRFGVTDPRLSSIHAVEMRVVRVHVEENLIVPGTHDHIDPRRWRPLIMSFCEFFGLSGRVHPSRLAEAWGLSTDQYDKDAAAALEKGGRG